MSFRRNTEEYREASKKEIFHFLKKNATNAYTADTLLKNLNENITQSSFKRHIKKNYEVVLSKLVSDQHIQVIQKNGQAYYSFPSV